MANEQKQKREQKIRRHARIRSKISGTQERPRLSLYRSHAHIYAQLIDDAAGKTLISVTDTGKTDAKAEKQKKIDRAFALGKKIAAQAKEKKIDRAVFDTGGNRFHGRVKQFAEGAREGGLKF